MKKLILFIFFSLIAGLCSALNLTNVTNNTTQQNQTVNLVFNSAVTTPKVFVAGNDLIIDFCNINNASGQNQYMFTSGFIREVDIVTVGSKTRILVVGGAKYRYQVNNSKNIYGLIFSDQDAIPDMTSKNVGLINLNKTSSSGSNAITINDVKFARDDNGGGVVEIPYSGDTKVNVKDERLGERLVVTLNGVGYKQELLKRLDVTDFDTPIKYVDTKSSNNQLTINVVNRGVWSYALYQLQNKLIINIRKASDDGTMTIPNLNTDAKTNRVSFNFQNIDVRALLQLLADFSGYNILVSDSVTGTMSLKLNNVPWDQALQIILNSKGLGMKRDGNVIRVAPVSELVALSKLQQDSDKSQEAVEPLDTATIRLKYAQAATIQSMVQQKGTTTGNFSSATGGNPTSQAGALTYGGNTNASLLSSRGSILIDTRTNTLIVNDTPSRLNAIKDLIKKIDIPVKQVLIEARIVEANSDFEKDLGTRLLLAGVGGSFTFANTLENGVTINQAGINSISASPSTYVNQNFGISNGATLAGIFAPNSNTLIGLEVDALELQSEGRTISSPKVMTANYQTANIQQGVQIPYQQASSAGNTNVAFVNATLSLNVTPQITDDGYILLNVKVQKDTPNTKLEVQGTPSIDTNSVNTQVRVKDGSTILIGGIYVDQQTKVQQQIPGLGDIPVLGWLFKAQMITNNKKELLIFITPRIIANSLDNDNG